MWWRENRNRFIFPEKIVWHPVTPSGCNIETIVSNQIPPRYKQLFLKMFWRRHLAVTSCNVDRMSVVYKFGLVVKLLATSKLKKMVTTNYFLTFKFDSAASV